MRIALVNPNTTAATTAAMVQIAQVEAAEHATVYGVTARYGVPLIAEPAALAVAAEAVAALAPDLAKADGVIVSAFGDPGLDTLRETLSCPVVGIAESGMAEAALGGRRFAVVTTTPDLRAHIAETAVRHGHASFAGTWTTSGDPVALTADRDALVAALAEACRAAVADGEAEAIVIGGGPLAMAARRLAPTSPVPLIEPVPAAVRRIVAFLNDGTAP